MHPITRDRMPYTDLVRRLAFASPDELRIVERVLGRLELHRERHGALDLAARNWRRERFEERLDALLCDVADELVLEDAAHEAARREFAPDQHSTCVSDEPARLAAADIDDREPYAALDVSDADEPIGPAGQRGTVGWMGVGPGEEP